MCEPMYPAPPVTRIAIVWNHTNREWEMQARGCKTFYTRIKYEEMADTRRYRDRKKYLTEAVSKKRKVVKLWSIKYKGGRCIVCGYDKCPVALDFHHVRGKKEFSVGNIGYSRSWKKLRQELDKCVLLCANCHREVEAGVTIIPNSEWNLLGEIPTNLS